MRSRKRECCAYVDVALVGPDFLEVVQPALDVPEVDVEELLALAEVLHDLVKLDAWIGEALRRRAAANCAAASLRLPKKTQRERLYLQLET